MPGAPPSQPRLAPSRGRCSLLSRGGCAPGCRHPDVRSRCGCATSYGPQEAGNRARECLPFRGFKGELLAALRCETVVLRPAIVLGCALLETDPASFDQTVKRWIQGPLL